VTQAVWIPDRGDVVWLDFDPQAGHEQAGRRPAVVLSGAAYNRLFNLAIVCPVTSREKGYLWEVPLPAGLPVSGFVLSDQVRNLDWRQRQARFIVRLDDDAMRKLLGSARRLLE